MNPTKKEVIILKQKWLSEKTECERCHRTKDLTLDHIIPKELVSQMGVDIEREYNPENYQCYCRVCNIFKGNRLDFANPKTKPMLMKYLNSI